MCFSWSWLKIRCSWESIWELLKNQDLHIGTFLYSTLNGSYEMQPLEPNKPLGFGPNSGQFFKYCINWSLPRNCNRRKYASISLCLKGSVSPYSNFCCLAYFNTVSAISKTLPKKDMPANTKMQYQSQSESVFLLAKKAYHSHLHRA